MSNMLRILLLVGAVLMLIYTIKSIRKSKIQMKDALVWVLIAVLIAIFGIFPAIPFWGAGMLGIDSAANMVFLIFMAIMILCIFAMARRISLLEDKLNTMAGEIAIRTKKDDGEEE